MVRGNTDRSAFVGKNATGMTREPAGRPGLPMLGTHRALVVRIPTQRTWLVQQRQTKELRSLGIGPLSRSIDDAWLNAFFGVGLCAPVRWLRRRCPSTMSRRTTRQLELWADSFHEGQWAARNIGKRALQLGGGHSERYELGFQPVHTYDFDGLLIELRVFGSYGSWTPCPESINELLAWGKPDFLLFDRTEDRILLAAEETAAVPTGNQALQRCERQYGAARLGVPFWYLLPEYGTHIDGGTRRSSIWPPLMALHLTLEKRTASVVLHFAALDSPEDYNAGTGMELLFDLLAKVLRNLAGRRELFDSCREELEAQFRDMLHFYWGAVASNRGFLSGRGCDPRSLTPYQVGERGNRRGPQERARRPNQLAVYRSTSCSDSSQADIETASLTPPVCSGARGSSGRRGCLGPK